MKEQRTREEIFTQSVFEWVKTERLGEVCNFLAFDFDANGVEYTCFTDGTRINSDLIGDIVLMHADASQVLGSSFIPEKTEAEILGFTKEFMENKPQTQNSVNAGNPVLAILEKSKKKTEKITITLTVKIPSTELYSVIRENFDDVDNVVLQSILEQVQEKQLRESLKRELQNIYNPKKKKT